MEEQNFRHIVRVVNTDLDGSKSIIRALRKIKGISFMFANLVCNLAAVEKNKKAGHLSDDELKKLEAVIKNPIAAGAPQWMVNRQSDPEEGTDKHLTGSDLKFTIENDIKMMKKMKSYKGIRHMYGLPVRGQRTRSNFRKNKGKVMGVQKKKIVAPPTKEKGKEK